MNIQIGDPNKIDEIISNKWSVTASLPDGVEAGSVDETITLKLSAISKDKYDERICFKSIEGVKLIRPAEIKLNLKDMKFEAGYVYVIPGDGEQFYMQNLCKILKEEYDNIKELTDFEEGLTYAQHRLLELNTFKYEYLHNPFYASSKDIEQFTEPELREWAGEGAEAINSTNK